MKKTLIIFMIILFVFSVVAFANGKCKNKKDSKCCKSSCVLCELDIVVTISNTDDGVLVAIKGKNKEDIKKIQDGIKECCFNKNANKYKK